MTKCVQGKPERIFSCNVADFSLFRVFSLALQRNLPRVGRIELEYQFQLLLPPLTYGYTVRLLKVVE